MQLPRVNNKVTSGTDAAKSTVTQHPQHLTHWNRNKLAHVFYGIFTFFEQNVCVLTEILLNSTVNICIVYTAKFEL